MADAATILPFPATRAQRIEALNARYRNRAAMQVLRDALTDPDLGRVALVSSFGAESVVLLHMISVIDRDTPVLFIDTQMLFPETLAYQSEVAAKLGLTDLRIIRAAPDAVAAHDPEGTLNQTNPDLCCHIRKTVPLEKALSGFDAWITGRKRFQGGARQALEFFEAEDDSPRIKVNPLAHWTPDDVKDYMDNNNLPRHPLVAKGYKSIGCAPCTSPVAEGEDPRAGRWRGQDKDECGIHFIGGKLVRGPIPADTAQDDAAQDSAATTDIAQDQIDKDGRASMTDDSTGAPFVPQDGEAVIVTDQGFAADDWTGEILDLAPDADLTALLGDLPQAGLIRVAFPGFSDGRGFTIARRLRLAGYTGRVRAAGHVIADQYAMARRSGFDEVEITADLARRQPWEQWQERAHWQGGYLPRLGWRA